MDMLVTFLPCISSEKENMMLRVNYAFDILYIFYVSYCFMYFVCFISLVVVNMFLKALSL